VNGTVQLEGFTATVAGRRVTVVGPTMPSSAEGRRIAKKARAIVAAREQKALLEAKNQPPSPARRWRDLNETGPWRRPAGNQLLARRWTGGNCLRAAVASILGADIAAVPEPVFDGRGWLARFDEQLREQTGYRLEPWPASVCPPRDPNQVWIATIREDGPADHCVVARGHFVIHDSLGEYTGRVPMDRLRDGLLVVPARCAVPNLSPLGSGRLVVAA
jgi:hypothetical protein